MRPWDIWLPAQESILLSFGATPRWGFYFASLRESRLLNIGISSISDQKKGSPIHFWNLNLVSRLKPNFQTRMSGWNNESFGEKWCLKPVWWDWYFGGNPKCQIVGSREFEGNWLTCILIAILYLLENTGLEGSSSWFGVVSFIFLVNIYWVLCSMHYARLWRLLETRPYSLPCGRDRQ